MHLVQRLKAFPFHVAGLLLFFITHGYTEYIGLIPFADMLLFFLFNLAISGIILWFFYKRTKSVTKAGLLTLYIIAWYFFFGALQDTLKSLPWLSGLAKYRYLLSGFLIVLILLFIYLKRSAKAFQRPTLYLNVLFIVFIVYDLAMITAGFLRQRPGADENLQVIQEHRIKDGVQKPDIFLVVLDEYSGSWALQNYFHYNNGQIEDFLRQQGFFVPGFPTTNYPSTPIMMASLLNMRYLDWFPGRTPVTVQDRSMAAKDIAENEVVAFLGANGYKAYNFSIFDLNGQPSRFETGLLPFKMKMITAKTMYTRMKKDIFWNIPLRLGKKISWLADQYQETFREGNNRMMALTEELLQKKDGQPRFVYTHLMMPHHPFLCDSTGKEYDTNYYNAEYTDEQFREAYLQYLVYANKTIAPFIQKILDKTNRQAVVILLSDHGLRDLNVPDNRHPWLNTLNAVYIPGEHYRSFRDTVSNVNQFRLVFNSLFHLQLPLLKDSCGVH